MSELFPRTSSRALCSSAVCAFVLHAMVLFGWSKVVMEESAYGMGRHPGPQGTFEMIAFSPEVPQPQAQAPETVPPKVVESEFKKKLKPTPKVNRAPKPSTPPTINHGNAGVGQLSGGSASSRAGAGSGGTSAEPDYLRNPAPIYPRASRLAREQGRVMLLVKVARDGRVLEAAVKSTSGFPRLDESALSAVAKWKFKPAMLAGILVETRVEVPIRFALK